MRVFIAPLLTLLAVGAAAADPPNIVIILADDMGYGDLVAYNPNSKIPTPHLDRLAHQGITFTDAHSTGSTCIPARFGLMTGTYPQRQAQMRDSKPLIPEDMPTIANLARDRGYVTAMVGKWHLGFVDKKNPVKGQPLVGGPMDRGFGSFFGIHASTDIPPYYYIDGKLPTGLPMKQIGAGKAAEGSDWNHIQGPFWRAGGIGQDLDLVKVTPRFTDEAIKVIKQGHESPLLLYVAYPSPHTPWLPTEEFVGKTGAGMYGDFMMQVDHEIGRILAALDEQKMADDTLVLFTSDNGPVWYEKDIEKYGHRSVGPLRGSKGSGYEGGHRMPFIVRNPDKAGAGSRTDALVSFVDVAATVQDLIGSKAERPKDSISFAPVLRGEAGTRTTLHHGRGKKAWVREGDWKYVPSKGAAGFLRDGEREGDTDDMLFNVREDIGENHNVADEHPEKLARLKSLFDESPNR